jgi:hypothetical protein
MKQLPVMVFLLWSCSSVAQTGSFVHEYKTGKSILMYSYIQRNDSSFIYGHLKEKKTHAPILNVNILVKDFGIGTVPGLDGNFTLFLPRQEGTLVFDKPGDVYFAFPYKFKKDDLKKPTAHH